MRGPNRDQPSYVIKTSPRLLRAREQAFESSLVGRLTAVIEAQNLCSVLDPLRQKIRMPTVAADAAIIENLVVIYAISQVLKLDRDQWNQFCLSEHWLKHRNRPRTNSNDSDHALVFVLRYAVADKSASSLTKRLNGLLQPFWASEEKAEQVSGLIIEKLKKKQPSRSSSWKIADQPAANELELITHRTSVTVKAIVHKDAKGKTVFEVKEIVASEVLEPPLL
ncbi:hypothetical protein DSM25558_2702 [Agrobacterium sp. DSM 25558]|nr:hypothetical protein DSM25558_2702 [Agrobacterium sp. DSM 25558]